jgi:hypothetical protein
MESYLGVAEEMGVTQQEIGAVQSVVMAVHAGRVNAQLNEVRVRRRAAARRKRSTTS